MKIIAQIASLSLSSRENKLWYNNPFGEAKFYKPLDWNEMQMLSNWWSFTKYRTWEEIKMWFMNYSLSFVLNNHENPVGSQDPVGILRATQNAWSHLRNLSFLEDMRKIIHLLTENCHLWHLLRLHSADIIWNNFVERFLDLFSLMNYLNLVFRLLSLTEF